MDKSQPSGNWWSDLVCASEFLYRGLSYRRLGRKIQENFQFNGPLQNSQVPKLQDPLLIVPGWNVTPKKFAILVDKLTSEGANGGRAVFLKDGQAFSDADCQNSTQIVPQDRVFVSVFDSVVDSPSVSAPQLAEAVRNLQSHGFEKVDALAYSLGGLSLRKMLNDTDLKLDQVAFLGTAHQGTRYATLADYIIKRDIGWALSLANLNGSHLGCMEWLKTWSPNDSQSNPQLDQLNRSLPKQLSGAKEFLSIAGSGLKTMSYSFGKTEDGDGLVPLRATQLEGVEHCQLTGGQRKHHGCLPADRDVLETLSDFYHWQPIASS